MASLCLLADDGVTIGCWELESKPVSVGRNEMEADIVIDDASLSRRHFVICRDAKGFIIQDLQSVNGTWVGGKRIVAERLDEQECIVAGRSVFMFLAPQLDHEPAASLILPSAASSQSSLAA